MNFGFYKFKKFKSNRLQIIKFYPQAIGLISEWNLRLGLRFAIKLYKHLANQTGCILAFSNF